MPGQLPSLGQGSITADILALKILPDLVAYQVEFIHELFSIRWRLTAQVEKVISQCMRR